MTAGSLEAKAEFLFRLRSRGIRDLAVLRAMEAVPRDAFVPHRYADLAVRDIALPLPCGQTLSEPSLVARMLEALGVGPGHRVLEVGSGSGYAAAVLARLGGDVLGVERFRTLAQAAKARLSTLGIANASVVWGDGLAVPSGHSPFDRILVHGALDRVPDELAALLAPDGTIVFATSVSDRQQVVRGRRDDAGAWDLVPVAPSRLRPLYDGPSRLL
ncbi:methyltransferase domain-containing protein [Lichenibacterium minor]|uniref:Protein-L-isoaspartate O-methyltransferase n=1 Tax=Lichenibacterium minor TaxID=2316528 RepID=A0A4Q2U8N0_9HYPH|nr:methyltransferase domain-containing protein [Lichenibacterium minor]RYC33103.1 methyltransferase domain-containing protein [Lichenibacterium minor]